MRPGAWAVVLLLLASLGVGLRMLWQDHGEGVSASGFDLSAVAARPPVVPAQREALPSSPPPLIGSVADPLNGPAARPAAGAPGRAAPPPAQGASPERRAQERAFLAAHGRELASYQSRLSAITERHRRRSKVVRDVDEAFGRMDRYMALKRRYERDSDPFSFARDAIALPEVREEISKRVKDPEVWKEAIAMVLDTLKESPPPSSLYGAAADFMGEPGVADYVLKFSEEASAQAPAIAAAIPPGTDLKPLQKIAADATAAPKR